jgi:hypothetical protein
MLSIINIFIILILITLIITGLYFINRIQSIKIINPTNIISSTSSSSTSSTSSSSSSSSTSSSSSSSSSSSPTSSSSSPLTSSSSSSPTSTLTSSPIPTILNVEELLNKVVNVFGLTENVTQDNFISDVVFKKGSDIVNNMMLFCNYAFPKLNIIEINKILKDINNTTMQDIFNKHNTDAYTLFIKKFDINSLLNLYLLFIYDEEDNNKIDYNNRLYIIVNIVYNIIKQTNDIELPLNIDLENDKYIINNIDLKISSNYKTNNIISIYIKTNQNELIPLESAEIFYPNILTKCLSISLCKYETIIESNLNTINILKTNIKNNKTDINRYFNLMFVISLLLLEEINIPPSFLTEMSNLNNKLINNKII